MLNTSHIPRQMRKTQTMEGGMAVKRALLEAHLQIPKLYLLSILLLPQHFIFIRLTLFCLKFDNKFIYENYCKDVTNT